MAVVFGGLQPADLLLGSLEELRDVLLGEARLLPQRDDLQCDIPRFPGPFKTRGKRGILQLLVEVAIEVGFLHKSFLSSQSTILSRAAFR